ncbi:MAG: hypothetical protein IT381_12300 [Deltaproteobacteria bacterium]|nr:hypothetical protein [Deltaproteobacteria bacterium]
MRYVLGLMLLVAGCQPANFGGKETEGDEACDGLDEANCLFPFPSDYFRKGGHLAFTERAMPRSADRLRFSPEAFNARDGYSAITPIYFHIAGATLAGAPPFDDLDASLATGAKTQVIDAETLERMPHWAELDHFSEGSEKPVIALRLASKLVYGKRYIVAVRELTGDDGAAVAPARGFLALRDKRASVVKGIDARRDRFEREIFAVLERASVPRKSLQLAFDFTVGSEDDATRDMYTVTAGGIAALPASGPEFSVSAVEEHADGPIARMVTGTVRVPSFLEATPAHHLRRLRRDDTGAPVHEGFEEIVFDLQIPRTALTSSTPAAVLQYGHGLLGRRGEAYNAWLQEMAERHNFLILGIDMQGMATADIEIWLRTFREAMAELPLVADKVHQGVLNHLAVTRMMKTSFLASSDPRWTKNGAPLYDPSRVYYYGNSQGGTMGALITTLHPDISRAVLGVPGGAFAFLLTRSVDFKGYALVVQSAYPEPTDFLAIMGLVQTSFDRMDPVNYAQHLSESHTALLHVAKEDAQVDNQVSAIMGRVTGATLIAPYVRPVWGLSVAPAPFSGVAYVEYDFGMPAKTQPNHPVLQQYDTHSHLRKSLLGQDQLWHFLETGEVVNLCDGPCNPD